MKALLTTTLMALLAGLLFLVLTGGSAYAAPADGEFVPTGGGSYDYYRITNVESFASEGPCQLKNGKTGVQRGTTTRYSYFVVHYSPGPQGNLEAQGTDNVTIEEFTPDPEAPCVKAPKTKNR